MTYTGEWISCDERFPEPGVVVLTAMYGTDIIYLQPGETLQQAAERVTKGPGHVGVSFYSKEDGGWCDFAFGQPEIVTPRFWSELPIPPKNPLADESEV